MKRNSSIVSVLVVIATLIAAPNAAARQTQTKQDENLQLQQIEQYVSQRRQAVEDYYADRLTELRLRAEGQIRLLQVADKASYSSLAAQAEVARAVLEDAGYLPISRRQLGAADTVALRMDRHEHESWLRLHKRRLRLHKRRPPLQNSLEIAPRRFVVAQTLITEAVNDIYAELEWETRRLERQKRYALTTGLAQFEKRLRENLLKGEPEPTYGAVAGIVYSSDNPSAVIDGKIVREEDTIHGAQVVKILSNSVEFEKNGKTWKQKVQQRAEEFWQ